MRFKLSCIYIFCPTVKQEKKAMNDLRYDQFYTLGSTLGTGGFGTVYAGSRIRDGKPVCENVLVVGVENLKPGFSCAFVCW